MQCLWWSERPHYSGKFTSQHILFSGSIASYRHQAKCLVGQCDGKIFQCHCLLASCGHVQIDCCDPSTFIMVPSRRQGASQHGRRLRCTEPIHPVVALIGVDMVNLARRHFVSSAPLVLGGVSLLSACAKESDRESY